MAEQGLEAVTGLMADGTKVPKTPEPWTWMFEQFEGVPMALWGMTGTPNTQPLKKYTLKVGSACS